jgi:hypothetical protein
MVVYETNFWFILDLNKGHLQYLKTKNLGFSIFLMELVKAWFTLGVEKHH